MLGEPLPVVWTRDSILATAGFEPVKDVEQALRRVRQALNAMHGHRRPDHRTRLDAAGLIFDLADVRKVREDVHADSQRPIQVALILHGDGGPPRAALSTDGVQVHLDGGDGQ